jgi:hypothetical protein
VFRGPISTNDGKVMIPAGEAWTSPADVYTKTKAFVKGVQGKVQG